MSNTLSLMRRAAGLLALAALGTGLLSSCKEDAPVPTPLDAPQAQLAAATVNSLTFTWSKIADAVQYGYSLTDPAGSEVDGGTTTATSVVFSSLKDNTTYTFKIMAFAGTQDTSHENSATTQLQATTGAIVPLAQPVLKLEVGEGTATISWEAVANADSYDYAYAVEGGTEVTGNTAETSLTLKLDAGKYTFTLQAISADAAYSASEKASAEFEVQKAEKKESWRASGTVDDGGGNTWGATLVAWTDGTYTLKDWYGTEGYDLDFTVNEDGTITVTNVTTSEGYDYVLADAEKMICIDTKYYEGYGAYSSFTGDNNAGEVWFWSYETNGWYDFVWPAVEVGESVTADDLAGTWAQYNTYQFWDGDWKDYYADNDITITKIDDKTVSIDGFLSTEEEGGKTITAALDAENGILTIEPQLIDEWYLLAGESAATAPVTAIYKDGTLTFRSWCLWYDYDGYQAYAYSNKSVLTKK